MSELDAELQQDDTESAGTPAVIADPQSEPTAGEAPSPVEAPPEPAAERDASAGAELPPADAPAEPEPETEVEPEVGPAAEARLSPSPSPPEPEDESGTRGGGRTRAPGRGRAGARGRSRAGACRRGRGGARTGTRARAADRRPVHRRRAARGRRPLRLHRARRVIPRPARRVRGRGIRVIATRHEGPASFMAEAHGQLTGRPAVCLGTRAVGGSNLAIGIHTARQNSTPDVRGRRPGRAPVPRSRGVPGDRPGRDPRRAGEMGGRAALDRGRRSRWSPRPSARRSAGGPARPSWPSPRTCSTSRCPMTRGSRAPARRRRERPTRRSGRSSSCWRRPGGR